MLRLTVCFLITGFLISANLILGPRAAQSVVTLTRLTDTPEHAVNLNPGLSDDGRVIVFESSADLAGTGSNSSFHALRADLSKPDLMFTEIGRSRIVSAALSGDGKMVAFASTEDLLGRNADRNGEIFLFAGAKLQQITETEAGSLESRLNDGNYQPSITADGRAIAFSSNRDLTGENADLSFEIFLYDTREQRLTQLTKSTVDHVAGSPKISANGSRVYYKRTAVAEPGVADLALIETETRASRVLVAGVSELSITEGRAVSNDGMRLVYSALTAPNQSQVFLFEAHDNSIRQLTQLGARVTDVRLQATISGDGRRVAFATRRRVSNASDGGVELYVLDLPTGKIEQITNAPAAATAEVIASLNFDGSLVAFNFARLLGGAVSDEDVRNNSEIFLATVPPRPIGDATISNAAARGNEAEPMRIAPGSIASIRGSALALKTERSASGELPFALAGTTVVVKGRPARLFYVAADEVIFVVPDGLTDGPAEFLVTNAEGLSSKAQAIISAAAPGLFTAAGDGRGEAIVVNADTFTTGPFDPSNGMLRLSIFATGVVRANNVSLTICGKPSVVERVAAANLIGLDEIHVLAPAELRGAGKCALVVTADGMQSNPVSVVIGGMVPTPTPTPTPSVTPTPTPTPTPSPSPSPNPTPTPLPSPSPNPTPIPSPSPTATPTPTPSPSPAPSPDASSGIVISQIYGGGGNAGAPFRNDFIEIFNGTKTSVNLSGWSVQYASATASTWSVTPLTAVTLLPGQYYLIQESSGGSNGIALPPPDATGAIAMAAGSGKVALVKNSTALTGSCPNEPNIVDLVGYGNTANCFRGAAPAPAPSNTNAILRAANGCNNTQNNLADFALGPANPRNASFLPRVCAN